MPLEDNDKMLFNIPLLSMAGGTAKSYSASFDYDAICHSKVISAAVPMDTAGLDRLVGLNFSIHRDVIYIGKKKTKATTGLVYPYISTREEK